MKETLTIKNFGPIKDITLDLKKVNVFIGDQGTGKSTVAKVLAMCRYFSYIVNVQNAILENQNQFFENFSFQLGLKNWGVESYLNNETKIHYQSSLYTFEVKVDLAKNKMPSDPEEENYDEIQTRIKSNSNEFTRLLEDLSKLRIGTSSFSSFTPNENFYRLNVKKVMDNPLFIPAERGYQSLATSRDSLLPEALIDELNKINRIVKGYNVEIEIKQLGLTFRNENGLSLIKKAKDEDYYYLHQGASGYQSSIPIFLAFNFNNSLEINKGRTIIVEEPEINLFPNRQYELVKFFAQNVNQFGNTILIPTHSPYILSSLNNLMYAYQVGQLNSVEASKVMDSKYWLNPDDVSCYMLEEGEAKSLISEDGLIKSEAIDGVSEILNEQYSQLFKLEMEYEESK